MASIVKDPNGHRRILVYVDGVRRPVRLGKASAKVAEAYKVKIEALASATAGGFSPDEETSRWLTKLEPKMLSRLERAGLVEGSRRRARTLKDFLDTLFKTMHVKAGTATFYGHTKRNLLEFFGATAPLRTVTPERAELFRTHLRTEEKLSAATVNRRTRVARQFFAKAVKWKLLAENPFGDVKAGSEANKSREFFVTREMADKVLAACPDHEWRLLFALSRYGGLRCPSEHLRLQWSDVLWDQDRFCVRASKTEHHEGGEMRWVPIFPELRPYLEESFAKAAEGATYVITQYRTSNVNLRTQLMRIITRAGLTPWARIFQNLRSTRETELVETIPAHMACAWIGNSEKVARKHYLQVTDEHFRAAAQGTLMKPDGQAAHRTARQPAVTAGNGRQDVTFEPHSQAENAVSEVGEGKATGPDWPRTRQRLPGKKGRPDQNGSISGPFDYLNHLSDAQRMRRARRVIRAVSRDMLGREGVRR